MSPQLVTATLLLILAAVAKAAVDILTHQEGNNIFEQRGAWFDARTSWKLKYKNYDGGDLRPRFFKSTTWLVAFTDFWHAADALYLSAYLVGGVLLGVELEGRPLWLIVVVILAVKVGFGGIFELCYSRWFRK